jgi:exonuclease SbcC
MHAARTEYDRRRDALAALAPPATDRADLTASWRSLVEWAAALAARRREETLAARSAAAETARSRETKLATIRAACEEAGVERLPGAPRDGVVRALADAESRLTAAREAQEEAQRLRERLRAEQVDQGLARALASHLSAPCFERWLLQEAFDRLVAAGSERLRELSSGDYSFRVDERVNFEIVDHRNADESRSARTLSGGETFLASLALALALADQVSELATEGACPLDSIFLDEGFGTLDPDALDTVAATIEELGTHGRTVGLVTHVRELADRIPVQYRVTKGPASSVVERVLA